MTTDQPQWASVGKLINQRMTVLALSQAELVRKSGVSAFTVRKLMRGEPGNYRADRLAKVATALDWPADAIDRILEDGGTTLTKPAGGDTVIAVDEERVDDPQALLNSLSDEDRQAVIDLMRRLHRNQG